MKHFCIVSRMPAEASDSQTVPPSIIIDFVVAILAALKPILTAIKLPTVGT